MASWKRITLAISFLLGGVSFFGYTSINQFNLALDDLSASSYQLANTHSAYQAFSRPAKDLASTTLDIFVDTATSTDMASTTPDMSVGSATSTKVGLFSVSAVPELSFIFPKNTTKVYAGCTYHISWKSSTAVSLLEVTLLDTGTRIAVGPKTSGLVKENVVEENLQNLNWKVGRVWPGEYYISVLKINGTSTKIKSQVFAIKEMPKDTSIKEKEKICKESGGSF